MLSDMTKGRVVHWISAGAASAVAAKLSLSQSRKNAHLVYCETGAEHPDNERFLGDLTRWLNAPIERIKSEVYADTWDVWTRRKFLSGPNGAPCTFELKVGPRLDWQLPSDIHVFGYTADAEDAARAKRLVETYPLMTCRFPLIDAGLTKQNVLAMIEGAGIRLPVLYGLGFQNNNCIPCTKATSPNYWSLVRREFPAEFDRMVKLSRQLGARLTRIKGERIFIDEIPADWPCIDPIQPACDFLCHFAEGNPQ